MKSSKPAFKSTTPVGTWEVVVDSCLQTESNDGRHGWKFDFRIRDDVEQENKGRHVFKSFLEDVTGVFPESKMNEYAFALGIEDGEEYEPWDLRGRCCQIVVKEFTPDDKPTEKVQYVAYARKSKVEPIKGATSADFSDVSADDNPFK